MEYIYKNKVESSFYNTNVKEDKYPTERYFFTPRNKKFLLYNTFRDDDKTFPLGYKSGSFMSSLQIQNNLEMDLLAFRENDLDLRHYTVERLRPRTYSDASALQDKTIYK